MKMKTQIVLLSIFLGGLLVSCGSVRYIDIETCKPAEVTFPETVGTILVVANAIEQPSDAGVEVTMYGRKIDTCSFSTDSLIFVAQSALAYAVNEHKYFNKVLFYNNPMRTDREYYMDVKLTQEQVDSVCKASKSDGIISIDRLLTKTKQTTLKLGYDDYTKAVDVEVTAILRAYIPGRTNALATILVKDTVPYATRNSGPEYFEYYMPPDNEILRISAAAVMEKAACNFVPFWTPETRRFYKGMSSPWKEASACAVNQKWERALFLWERLFNNAKAETTKAKLSANIALCYEIKGEFTKALEWLTQANAIFEAAAKGNESDANATFTKHYLELLSERMRAENKLKIQFGEE